MSILHRLAKKKKKKKNLFGQSSFPPGMVSVLCQTVMKVFVVYFAMNNGLNDSSGLVELYIHENSPARKHATQYITAKLIQPKTNMACKKVVSTEHLFPCQELN